MRLPEKRCIYTVITNEYDPLFSPLEPQPGWDMLAFTDTAVSSPVWQVRPLPELPELSGLAGDPVRTARLVKILAHRFLQEYEYSVYVDGNRILNGNMDGYVSAYDADMLCLGPVYADAYAAADALINRPPPADELAGDIAPPIEEDERRLLRAQMEAWKSRGLPAFGGCPGTGILGRRHNAEVCVAVAETWAEEVLRGSAFDEPAFPFACFCHGASWGEGLARRVPPNEPYSPAWEFAPAMPHAARLAGGAAPEPPVYPPNPPPPGGKFGGYPLLLTIGVPVSNQIGTIRRCLEGIKPILDAVPSELLVVDTGSKDGTVEVCGEFGARVVAFPWINDMSAARNAGVRNARGMWYLSIDDDEWFEDASDIIAFFNDPRKYGSYDALQYLQVNYLDDFGKDSVQHYTRRCARMTPGLHFEGRIHDALADGAKGSAFRDYFAKDGAKHYGFSKTDAEAGRAKFRRNLAPLKCDLAQFPYDARYAIQICNEYFVQNRYADGYPFAFWTRAALCAPESGMSLTANIRMLTNLSRSGFYAAAARYAAQNMRAEDYGTEDRCAIYNILMTVYFALRDYEKVVELHRQYAVALDACSRRNEADRVAENWLSRAVCFDRKTARALAVLHFSALAALGKTEEAEAQLLQPDLLENLETVGGAMPTVCGYILDGQHWGFCRELWRARLALDDTKLYELYPDVLKAATAQTAPGILGVLADIGAPQSAFEPLLRLRAMQPDDSAAGYEAVKAQAAEAREKMGAFRGGVARYFKEALLLEALRVHFDTSLALAGAQVPEVDDCFTYLEKSEDDLSVRVYSRVYAWYGQNVPCAPGVERYFRMKACRLILDRRAAEAEADPCAYAEVFVDYIHMAGEWDSRLYSAECLQGGCDGLLPAALQTDRVLQGAVAAYDAKDPLGALRLLREALDTDERFGPSITALTAKIKAEAEEQEAPRQAQTAEFNSLLLNIEPKIEQLIAAGMRDEALAVIGQLEALAPGAPALEKLRAKAKAVD